MSASSVPGAVAAVMFAAATETAWFDKARVMATAIAAYGKPETHQQPYGSLSRCATSQSTPSVLWR